jgi:hypothetical protein
MKLSEANRRANSLAEELHIAPQCRAKFVETKVREYYCEA